MWAAIGIAVGVFIGLILVGCFVWRLIVRLFFK